MLLLSLHGVFQKQKKRGGGRDRMHKDQNFEKIRRKNVQKSGKSTFIGKMYKFQKIVCITIKFPIVC
jgi:hypothetical protein